MVIVTYHMADVHPLSCSKHAMFEDRMTHIICSKSPPGCVLGGRYGTGCYQKNSKHRQGYTHPGDTDWPPKMDLTPAPVPLGRFAPSGKSLKDTSLDEATGYSNAATEDITKETGDLGAVVASTNGAAPVVWKSVGQTLKVGAGLA